MLPLFFRSQFMRAFLLKPVMLACLFTLLPISADRGTSHTPLDPDGRPVTWYPHECCHDHDCQAVASVRPTREGLWVTLPNGTSLLVSLDEPRRPSRDMRWHICLAPHGHRDVYRLSRFETGPNRGDWLVVVQYDQAAHETLQAAIAQDAECQQAFAEIAKFATRISRELVLDLDI
jgi:hypothetical protein